VSISPLPHSLPHPPPHSLPRSSAHPLVVVMGVSGSGKSTIGQLLADRLGVAFIDGDDLHPAANIAKMTAGIPLTDTDRAPWLEAVGDVLEANRASGLVVACSALRRAYRDLIARTAPGVFFVHLDVDATTLADRMTTRPSHFMPVALLTSQLATLEPLQPDEPGTTIPAALTPTALVDELVARLPHP